MYPDASLYIDGEWTKGSGGRSQPILNPATGDAIGKVPFAERADLDRALAATLALPDEGGVDFLCCGAAGRIALLADAADRRDDDALRVRALADVSRLVRRARRRGGYRLFHGVPADVDNPSLLRGSAGIAWLLVRLARPELAPDPLRLA
jgi:lantibiotic modifying enzyme